MCANTASVISVWCEGRVCALNPCLLSAKNLRFLLIHTH